MANRGAVVQRGAFMARTRRPRWRPNYGYEPYWPGGAWVYSDPRAHSPAAGHNTSVATNSTTRPDVCGDECDYLYLNVKEVCVQQLNRSHENWCSDCQYQHNRLDQYFGYQTFDTYCAFLAEQCQQDFNHKFVFLHVGRCLYGNRTHEVVPDPFFKDMNDSAALRVQQHLRGLATRMHNVSGQLFGR